MSTDGRTTSKRAVKKINERKLKEKEIQKAKEWYEKVDKLNDPFALPRLELAQLQAEDKTLENALKMP